MTLVTQLNTSAEKSRLDAGFFLHAPPSTSAYPHVRTPPTNEVKRNST